MSRLRTVMIALVAGALLAACGGGDGDAGASPSPTDTAPTSPPASTPTEPAAPPTTEPPAPTDPGTTPADPGATPGDPGTAPGDPGVTPSPAPTTAPVEPDLPSVGVLVGVPEAGVEAGCLVLDGYLLLGGDRELLSSGRELRITGAVEKVMTTCQQGIPYRVESAVPVEP